jgi:hypothetical protein
MHSGHGHGGHQRVALFVYPGFFGIQCGIRLEPHQDEKRLLVTKKALVYPLNPLRNVARAAIQMVLLAVPGPREEVF